LLVLLAACKAQISGPPPAELEVDAPVVELDAPAPTPIPTIDAPAPLGAWSMPQKIDVASSGSAEDDVTLSSNTLELFFAISGSKGKDLYYATRASTTSAWTPAVPLAFNSTSQSDETPRLSADDRTLYFASGRGGNGTLDIYQTTRSAAGATDWSLPAALDSSVNTPTLNEKWFMLCTADHYLMVQGTQLVEGFLGGAGALPATPLNANGNQTGTFLTPDCLTIYFATSKAGKTAIYHAQRARASDPWDAPGEVTDFAALGGNQEDPWISSDQRTFAFASDAVAAGNKDLHLSTR
jgi:Tol biopolymer transport system component